MPRDAVPDYFLYGEAARRVDVDFLHVEPLDDRSRSSAWRIPPHAHGRLQQLFLVASGGGVATFEGTAVAMEVPAMVVVPAGVAHGFDWRRDSAGFVLTFAADVLERAAAREPAFRTVFERAEVYALAPAETSELLLLLGRMLKESSDVQAGASAFVEGVALCVLAVALRRVIRERPVSGCAPPAQAELVARFRREVEARFPEAPSIRELTQTLGVSASRLRAACAAVVGEPPARLLQARALAEARRLLLYTTLPVAQVGEAAGFADGAYFSRVFSQRHGVSPSAFRAGGRRALPA